MLARYAIPTFDVDFKAKRQQRGPANQWSEIRLLEELSPWVITCLRKISSFSELEQGWDSYGSDPIQAPALAATTKFILEMPVERVPEPSVSPVAGGGIGFHWRVANRDLEVEFLPTGVVEYLKTSDGKSEEGTLANFGDPGLWRWLAGESS